MSVLSSRGGGEILSLRREVKFPEAKALLTEDLKAIRNLKRAARFMVVAGVVAVAVGLALFALGIVSFFTPAWGVGIFLLPFSCVLMAGGVALTSFADKFCDRRIKAIQEEAKAAMNEVGLSH